MKETTWYVVWCEQHGSPSVKHDDASSAISEAKRLARLHPGLDFHVLALMGTAKKVEVEYREASGISPF